MAKETLLDSDIAAGARFVEALDKKGEMMNAALWFYYPDVAQWKLLLVSPTFDKTDRIGPYTKVSKLLSDEDEIGKNISISDIKILRKKDPLMKILKGIMRTVKG